MGGIANPIDFLWKTLVLLLVTAALQSLFARLRIDQTVGMWWRTGTIVVLVQLLVIIIGQYFAPVVQPFVQKLIGG